MLKAITAPPGGGKSCYGMVQILRELLSSDRLIVTNIPVRFDSWTLGGKIQKGLVRLVLESGSGLDGEAVRKRVKVIDDDQVKVFWRHRYLDGLSPTVVVSEDGSVPDVKDSRILKVGIPYDGGVLYVIDEIHDVFNAHEWQHVGKEAIFYVSKHRHLEDDIWCMSQAMGNVVKQFRSIIQETVLVRNLGYERMGPFTLPQRTIVRGYLYCPANFSGQTPLWSSIERFGRGGIRESYNTAVHAGRGSAGDVGKRHVRGLHWSLAILGLLLVLGGIFAVSEYGPRLLLRASDSGLPQPVLPSPVVASSAPAFSPVLVSRPNPDPDPDPDPDLSMPGYPRVENLYMTGYARVGDGWRVILSDGRTFSTGDPEFLALERSRVNISGKWVPLAPTGYRVQPSVSFPSAYGIRTAY